MNIQTRNIITTLVVSSSSFASFTQASSTLNPVVITATKTTQTADSTLSPVIVIGRKEIEANQGASLANLLRLHAGIDIGQNGGRGQSTSIFIRGTESNHTLMLIDGVKINPGTIGGPAVQNIRLDMIDRIEIVKGPRSTLYGSDAIGGVINIITRKLKSGTETNASISHGSYNSSSFMLSTHGSLKKARFGLTFNKENTDGFSTRTTSTTKRGYKNTSLQSYLAFKALGADVKLSHWTSYGNTEYLSFFLNPVDQDYRNTVTALDIKQVLSDSWVSKMKLSRIKDVIDQNQSGDFAHTTRNTLDWQHDLQLTTNQLITAGIYISSESASASSFGTGFNIKTDIDAVFVQDNITLGKHHIIGGARFTNHQAFGDFTTWNLEYGYRFNAHWSGTLAANTGFRAADATDRFGFGGVPGLTPEESINYELGLRYKTGPHKISLNVFDNTIDNLIVYNTGTSLNENLEKATIKGIELAYKYHIRHWNLSAELISQDPKNETNGKQLARRAKRSLTLGAEYIQPRYRIGAQLLNTSVRPDSDFSTIINSAYTLVHMTGVYNISKDLTLNGRIENLFDEKYTLANGFRTAERSYYVGLNYRFK